MTFKEPTGEEPTGERPNNEFLLFSAYAMSLRILREAQWAQKTESELSGEHLYVDPSDELSSVLALVGSYQLIDMLEGLPPRTVQQYIDEASLALSDDVVIEFILKDKEEFEDFDPSTFRELCINLARNNAELSKSFSGVTADALIMHEKAKELAKLKGEGTTVEAIFFDDDLYAELMRYMYDPAEMSRRLIASLQSITVEAVADFILANQAAIVETLVTNDKGVKELQKEVEKPEFELTVLEKYHQIITTQCIIFEALLRRYWGEGIIDKLPQEIQQALKSPLKDSTI